MGQEKKEKGKGAKKNRERSEAKKIREKTSKVQRVKEGGGGKQEKIARNKTRRKRDPEEGPKIEKTADVKGKRALRSEWRGEERCIVQ